MSTQKHLTALEQARIEAHATLRDMHEADGAVEELKANTKPWTITCDCKNRVREVLRDFKVLDVDVCWSWMDFKWLYKLTIRA